VIDEQRHIDDPDADAAVMPFRYARGLPGVLFAP
jgi:hypothetical protein